MKPSRCLGTGVLLLGLLASCAKTPPPPPPSVVLVPATEKSSHFDAVNRHLDLGGTLYGYVDIDGDADRVADMAQGAIQQLIKSAPGMESVSKLQLKPIFKVLGIDDVKAMGLSSAREGGDDYRNRAFLYTPEGRHGILAVLGGPAGPLKHLNLAPADADLYEEFEFNLPALTAAIKQVMIEVKGKEAADQIQQQIESGGQMMGVAPLALLHSLTGRLTVVIKMEPGKTLVVPGAQRFVLPRFSLLLGIDGLGAALKPLLDKSPMLGMKEENGRQYYVPNIPMMIDGFRPVLVTDGSDLYFSTSEFFAHECMNRAAGTGLGQNPDFHRLLTEMGPDANILEYMTPRLFTEIQRLPELNPELPAQSSIAIKVALDSIVVPDRPVMTLTQNLSDGVLLKGRMNRSLKPALIAVAVYNPVTIGLLVALQQQKVKAALGSPTAGAGATPPTPRANLTPDERVLRNLRLLKALSDAYYRRTGTETATFGDLVGPGKLIPRLQSIEGEDYSTIQFAKGQPIEVKLGDGRTLKLPVVRRQ